MRIEQLAFLAAVTEHGSLRRASTALHVSQPALSEALAKLERELGVTLLDRRRSGARISRRGQELLPYMSEVLDAVERLRQAAGDESAAARRLRVGTVNAASSSLLLPAVQDFRQRRPGTDVEVLSFQQSEIFSGLTEGSLDMGLVNVLAGDDVPPGLRSQQLLRGRPVVCLPTAHRLAGQSTVSPDDLRAETFVWMRAGYLMHRFTHRLFGSRPPTASLSTDGAEMGKLMVAEGLGVTILPDYSVDKDPLTAAGLLSHRPLDGDATEVRLLMVMRDQAVPAPALRALEVCLLARARHHGGAGSRTTVEVWGDTQPKDECMS